MRIGILFFLIALSVVAVILTQRFRNAKKKDEVSHYVCDSCGEEICECRKIEKE